MTDLSHAPWMPARVDVGIAPHFLAAPSTPSFHASAADLAAEWPDSSSSRKRARHNSHHDLEHEEAVFQEGHPTAPHVMAKYRTPSSRRTIFSAARSSDHTVAGPHTEQDTTGLPSPGIDYNTAWASRAYTLPGPGPRVDTTAAHATKRRHSSPPRPPAATERAPLSGLVLAAITGAVANMWAFCRSALPFRGFRAGPGAIYNMTTWVSPAPRPQTPVEAAAAVQASSQPRGLRRTSSSIALPGQYPPAARRSIIEPAHATTPRRGDGWVLVETGGSSGSGGSRRASSPATRPRTQHPRSSGTSRALPRRRSRVSLSLAREATAAERRASLPTAAAAAIGAGRGGRASLAGSTGTAQKVAREQRRNEASLRRLNGQLQDMIREGKAALAMRVEVVAGDEDGEGNVGGERLGMEADEEEEMEPDSESEHGGRA